MTTEKVMRIMRALVVSDHHPDEPAIFERWVTRLLGDGWDVVYAAPFAEHGVPPHDGLTGLNLPVAGAGTADRKIAASVLMHRGPEADLVVVSSERLASFAPATVPVFVASAHIYADVVRSREDGLAGSSAIPFASRSDGAGRDRSAILH